MSVSDLFAWTGPKFKTDEPSRHESARDGYKPWAPKKPRKCGACAELFVPPSGRKAFGTAKFCSRKCYYASVGTRPAFVTATCAMCQSTFQRTVAAIKRVKHTFCSRECASAFHTGERSPMFRGDKDPNRGASWNRRAASIRERDSYTCRRCGRGECGTVRAEKLSVDHVRPWRSFTDKEAANHPDNLVSLCRECHSYKTTVVERAWLNGDNLTFQQWVRSLHLPSEAIAWIAGAERAPVAPPVTTNGNVGKAECIRGHAFTPENTRVRYGKRECMTCVRIRSRAACRRAYAKKKANREA